MPLGVAQRSRGVAARSRRSCMSLRQRFWSTPRAFVSRASSSLCSASIASSPSSRMASRASRSLSKAVVAASSAVSSPAATFATARASFRAYMPALSTSVATATPANSKSVRSACGMQKRSSSPVLATLCASQRSTSPASITCVRRSISMAGINSMRLPWKAAYRPWRKPRRALSSTSLPSGMGIFPSSASSKSLSRSGLRCDSACRACVMLALSIFTALATMTPISSGEWRSSAASRSAS
mmetsp:Transcript_44517/g.139637  ORF Transcript_44517/g.139637 Transcript_44517/m.139637 type:complete len:241 (-) Transcript_44517:724-1446(-)